MFVIIVTSHIYGNPMLPEQTWFLQQGKQACVLQTKQLFCPDIVEQSILSAPLQPAFVHLQLSWDEK